MKKFLTERVIKIKILTLTLIFVLLFSMPALAFNFSDVPRDKRMHFKAGLITYAVGKILDFDKPMTLVLSVSAAKETYDYLHENHTCEFADFAFTITGGFMFKLIDFRF